MDGPEILECAAPMYLPGVRRAEWLHSASRNRRDPSRHRSSPIGVVALCHSVIAGSGEAYKQLDCEVAERRAEVGAGHISDERRNNRTRRSEGPVAGCAARSEGLRACCNAIYPSTAGGQVHAESTSLKRSPTHWHCGMRALDGPVESRMRENFMSGSGRGCRKQTAARGFAPASYSTPLEGSGSPMGS